MTEEFFNRQLGIEMKKLRLKMAKFEKANILQYANLSGKMFEMVMSGDFDQTLTFKVIFKIKVALGILEKGNPKVVDFLSGHGRSVLRKNKTST